MSTKKKPSFCTHFAALTTGELAWNVLEVLAAWFGLIYFVATDRPGWAVFCGVYYLGCMVRTVGRELAYRDDKRARPSADAAQDTLFGEIA
jgi:hypothetical protein